MLISCLNPIPVGLLISYIGCVMALPGITGDNAHTRLCFTCLFPYDHFLSLTQGAVGTFFMQPVLYQLLNNFNKGSKMSAIYF